MINRIELVREPIEKILDKINPSWKQEPLYSWQWDSMDRREYDPRKFYNLNEFNEDLRKDLSIFTKAGQFLVETQDHFYNILTNIEPETKNLWIYNPRSQPLLKTLNKLL